MYKAPTITLTTQYHLYLLRILYYNIHIKVMDPTEKES